MKDDTFYYLKGPSISTRLKTRSNVPEIDPEDSTGVFQVWTYHSRCLSLFQMLINGLSVSVSLYMFIQVIALWTLSKQGKTFQKLNWL